MYHLFKRAKALLIKSVDFHLFRRSKLLLVFSIDYSYDPRKGLENFSLERVSELETRDDKSHPSAPNKSLLQWQSRAIIRGVA